MRPVRPDPPARGSELVDRLNCALHLSLRNWIIGLHGEIEIPTAPLRRLLCDPFWSPEPAALDRVINAIEDVQARISFPALLLVRAASRRPLVIGPCLLAAVVPGAQASSSSCFRSGGASPPLGGRWR
jgi:hypothetical protein